MKIGHLGNFSKDTICKLPLGDNIVIKEGTKYVVGFDKNLHIISGEFNNMTLFISSHSKQQIHDFNARGISVMFYEWLEKIAGDDTWQDFLEEINMSDEELIDELEYKLENIGA